MIVKEFGGCFNVTPDDDNDLPTRTVGLYIGHVGNVIVDDYQGHNATFTAVPTGTILMGDFKRVYNTGTTATLIVAFTSP